MDQKTFAIMGAGISGLAAAYNIRKRYPNAKLVIYEREKQVGGTWFVNTYPGAACDVQSHLYSLSFALNPNWTQAWSSQTEILAYLVDTAEKNGLMKYIKFEHRFNEARWSETRQQWLISVTDLSSGRRSEETADFVFAGPGALCEPAGKPEEWPGVSDFTKAGKQVLHSARWDHSQSFAGKHAAVIGTGASAAQIVPAMVDSCKHITLVQRTPAWVVPRGNYYIPESWKSWFRAIPFLLVLYRIFLWMNYDLRFYAFIRPVAYLNKYAVGMARRYLSRRIPDPVLREKLTPHYPMGCKRVVVSDDFYYSVRKPNVTLVASAMTNFTAKGIKCADGTEVECDAVVLATGFDVAASFPGVPFYGRNGTSLAQMWKEEGPHAYYGVLVPHMPNLFMLVGPNTGLGHNSIIAMIECQVRYALACVDACMGSSAGSVRSVTVTEKACKEYNEWVQAKLAGCVWTNCASWYNAQGKKNCTMWPETVTSYWWKTMKPDVSALELQ